MDFSIATPQADLNLPLSQIKLDVQPAQENAAGDMSNIYLPDLVVNPTQILEKPNAKKSETEESSKD
jgi:hypothetical protein